MHPGGAWLLVLPCALAANLPTFTYSVSNIQINAITTDSAGNTYLTGTNSSGMIATTPGAFQSQDNSGGLCGGGGFVPIFCIGSAFVVKLDPTGAVIFATYLGGNGETAGNAIAVDHQGN